MPSELDALEWMPDGVILCDAEGKITFVNRKAEAMTGFKRAELIGRKVDLLLPAGSRSAGGSPHRRRSSARSLVRALDAPDVDLTLRRKDGTMEPVDVAVGQVGTQTIAVIRDMTGRRAMEEALEHRALHDPLTELANRNLFFDRLRQAIHAARREGRAFALVMLDIDGFKSINDRYGHTAGDDVLRQLGARIGAGLRATDTAARIGGDEFTWILQQATSRESVGRIVQKRVALVRAPLEVAGQTLEIGVSAGIAMYPDDGRDADALMRHADAAMYAAKRLGREVSFHPTRAGRA